MLIVCIQVAISVGIRKDGSALKNSRLVAQRKTLTSTADDNRQYARNNDKRFVRATGTELTGARETRRRCDFGKRTKRQTVSDEKWPYRFADVKFGDQELYLRTAQETRRRSAVLSYGSTALDFCPELNGTTEIPRLSRWRDEGTDDGLGNKNRRKKHR